MDGQRISTWSLRIYGVLLAASLVTLFLESRPRLLAREDPRRTGISAACRKMQNATATETPTELTLGTFNLWHGGAQPPRRFSALAENLCNGDAEFFPEVLLLQEVKNYAAAFGENFVASEVIAGKLGDYWVHTSLADNGAEGVALLVRRRASYRDVKFRELPPPNTDDIGGPATALVEITIEGDLLVRIANVKLTRDPVAAETRTRQITRIMQWITVLELNTPSDLLILGGDFGTGLGAEFYDGEFDAFLQDPHFDFLVKPNDTESRTRTHYLFSSQQKDGRILKTRARERVAPMIDAQGQRYADQNSVIHRFSFELATPPAAAAAASITPSGF